MISTENHLIVLLSEDITETNRKFICEVVESVIILQCFDAVGWATGRASSL